MIEVSPRITIQVSIPFAVIDVFVPFVTFCKTHSRFFQTYGVHIR